MLVETVTEDGQRGSWPRVEKIRGRSGKYKGFGLNGTERTTIIIDIFNINQTVRDTGVHLKVEKEQWRIAQGSKRQARVLSPRVQCQGYGSQILLIAVKNSRPTRSDRKIVAYRAASKPQTFQKPQTKMHQTEIIRNHRLFCAVILRNRGP